MNYSLIPIGRTFFALGLLGLAVEHFIFGDFVTGRAPAWPESMPGRLAWAAVSGATLIWISIAILIGKQARAAAILGCLLIVSWALIRHLPVLAAESFLSGAWTRAGKALTFAAGMLVMAAASPGSETSQDFPFETRLNVWRAFIELGRFCLGLFLLLTGIQHFMFTEFVASLIPEWFPGDAVAWTYFAGVALIAGGIGLFVPRSARLAALLSGLMVFSWFWIVHIPRAFGAVTDSIAVFEALAVSGLAFVLAGAAGRSLRLSPSATRAAVVVAGAWVLAGCGAPVPADARNPILVVPIEEAEFAPVDPARPSGPRIATLWGDPDRGPSAMLLRMERSGGRLHYHSSDYHLAVIEGEMKHWARGEQEADAPVLGPGSYWFQPGGEAHADSCLADLCLMFVKWSGRRDGALAEEPGAR